jgi:O-antigen/teichoic acid export membrane protein
LSGSRSYGRGAAVLSLGIGATGLITFAYFSLASYSLPEDEYGHITLLWSAVFITVSVLYRPVEQLLSRTIADRDARGVQGREHLRIAATIQLALGVLFAVLALVLRDPIENDLFGGSSTLYWVLVVAVLAYAASYFARGYLAGHRHFGLYGGLVLMEASSRCVFALAVAIGIAEGQSAVALGMAAAPIVSLAVVPPALARRLATRAGASEPSGAAASEPSGAAASEPSGATAPEPSGAAASGPYPALLDAAARDEPAAREPEFTLARGAGFAAAVLLIMLCEQTFLNAGPLLVKATEDSGGAALAGFTFNVLLIARAPLQLFQAVQTSILPHLTRLRASGESDPFRRSVNLTLTAIAGFAGCVALVMLAAGPQLMDLLFGGDFDYERGGLVLVAIGMGLYLSAATLNQALLAHGLAAQAAACWLTAAAAFVLFLLLADFDDRVLQVELAFVGAAAVLSAALYALYRRAHDSIDRSDRPA